LSKLGRDNSKRRPRSASVGKRPLRALRANRVFRADEKRIRTENTVMNKCTGGVGVAFLQDRRLRTDTLFIRAQPAIRADGPLSAQAWALLLELSCFVRATSRSANRRRLE
jgi:hypothetical protein